MEGTLVAEGKLNDEKFTDYRKANMRFAKFS